LNLKKYRLPDTKIPEFLASLLYRGKATQRIGVKPESV